MTTIVRTGDVLFPDRPKASMTLPDGWVPLPSPEVVVAGAVAEWSGFRPNVTITFDRVAGAASIEDVGPRVWEQLSQSPEFAGNGNDFIDAFGGRASYGMEGGFRMPEVGAVYQVCAVTVVPHGEVSDVVYAVGSADSTKATELVPVIREIIASVVLLGDTDER